MVSQAETGVLVRESAFGEELAVVAAEAVEEHVAHWEVDYKDMEEVASAGEGHNVDIGIQLAEGEVRSE